MRDIGCVTGRVASLKAAVVIAAVNVQNAFDYREMFAGPAGMRLAVQHAIKAENQFVHFVFARFFRWRKNSNLNVFPQIINGWHVI